MFAWSSRARSSANGTGTVPGVLYRRTTRAHVRHLRNLAAATTRFAHLSVDPAEGVVEGARTYGAPVLRHVSDEPVLAPMRVPPELRPELRAYLATLRP